MKRCCTRSILACQPSLRLWETLASGRFNEAKQCIAITIDPTNPESNRECNYDSRPVRRLRQAFQSAAPSKSAIQSP